MRNTLIGRCPPIDTSRQPKVAWRSPYLIKPREDLIPIARRLELSFDGGTTEQIVPLATGVDVSAWARGAMLFILHAKTAWTGGAGPTSAIVDFVAESVSLDPEAPELPFVDTFRTVAVSPTITAATAAPLHTVADFNGPYGPALRVRARFRQGITPASAPQTLTVSLYFLGRRA